MATGGVQVIGFERLRRRFRVLGDAIVDPKILGRMGEYLLTSIKTRTLRGKDVDNRDFVPYSAEYALFRKSAGRPINKVDLFFTGSMLNSLSYDVLSRSVKLYFMPGQDRFGMSNPAKAFYLQQKRKFFGWTVKDERMLNRMYRDHVKRKGLEG